MPLQFLLDENLRGGGLWQAIQQHNAAGAIPIDAIRVGDPPDLPLGTPDGQILSWAEQAARILVSFDRKTLSGHLANHLKAGNHSPGVFLLRPGSSIPQIVFHLELATAAGDPASFRDRIEYVP
jgi:hypothetical protein